MDEERRDDAMRVFELEIERWTVTRLDKFGLKMREDLIKVDRKNWGRSSKLQPC